MLSAVTLKERDKLKHHPKNHAFIKQWKRYVSASASLPGCAHPKAIGQFPALLLLQANGQEREGKRVISCRRGSATCDGE